MSYCVTDGDEPAKAPEAKKKKQAVKRRSVSDSLWESLKAENTKQGCYWCQHPFLNGKSDLWCSHLEEENVSDVLCRKNSSKVQQ